MDNKYFASMTGVLPGFETIWKIDNYIDERIDKNEEENG